MQYLAQWRMQAAARLLLETRGTVASIAVDVGYGSEAAFARAFKRSVGKPPAAWRRERDEDTGQAKPLGDQSPRQGVPAAIHRLRQWPALEVP